MIEYLYIEYNGNPWILSIFSVFLGNQALDELTFLCYTSKSIELSK